MNSTTLTDAQLDAELATALAELRMADFHTLGDEADRRLADKRARLAQPGALAAAAHWYAANGVPVFPCMPSGKAPLLKAVHLPADPARATCRGECGRLGHGLHDATTDLDQVGRWWQANPQANIGVATGHRFDVIDIDGVDGYRSFGLMREQGLLPAALGWAATPRGGMHMFIAPTGDGNAANLRLGVDYRGTGGYVVAAPSIGPNGSRYDWLEPLNVAELPA